jgi:hypothetical protein
MVQWTETCRSEYIDILIANLKKKLCLIRGTFVGEKNFDVINMHGTTIRKN